MGPWTTLVSSFFQPVNLFYVERITITNAPFRYYITFQFQRNGEVMWEFNDINERQQHYEKILALLPSDNVDMLNKRRQYAIYQDNGGTMKFDEFLLDGRYDPSNWPKNPLN